MPASPADRRIEGLFQRLVLLYGTQRLAATLFVDAPAAVVKAAWRERLARFTDEAIAGALGRLEAEPGAWPPNLVRFSQLCDAATPRKRWQPALPEPKRTPEQLARGREHLERIRSLMGRAARRAPSSQGDPLLEREPGCDDEPTATPACTCAVGLQRAPGLCPACATWAIRRGEVAAAVPPAQAREGAR